MVSDRPRDQESDAADASRDVPRPASGDPADEPVTGAPAGASGSPAAPTSPSFSPGSSPVSGSTSGPTSGSPSGPAGKPAGKPAGTRAAGATAAPGPRTYRSGILGRLRPPKRPDAATGPPGEKERRRRRWFVAGISAGAALIVIALCAGTFAVVSAIDGFQDRTDEARETRRLRDGECLSLEQRLNRLVPPGATTTPQARAVSIRNENSAVRIYVSQIRGPGDPDRWRQLLDARTAYAEALDLQAKSRAPAFYVPPRAPDGVAVTDELVDWSPEPCAGPIRRLAVPDL
jgi:hypothetical protein